MTFALAAGKHFNIEDGGEYETEDGNEGPYLLVNQYFIFKR